MGTFIIILIIIAVVAGFMSRSSPTINIEKNKFKNPNQFSSEHYNSLPFEIRTLIENNKSFELAELLVKIELDGHIQNLNILLKAIKYKNYELSGKVDSIRNDLRQRNYLK